MEKVSVIIPAYNEDLGVLEEVIKGLFPFQYSIIVVDDGSSPSLAQPLSHLPITVVTHGINLGQGAAIQTGFALAAEMGTDYALTFDADGQHSIEDIEPLLAPLRNGSADIAIGSRFLSGSVHNAPLLRQIIFKIAKTVNKILFSIPFSDTHNGLRALNKTALQQIKLTENRMAHASEILHQVIQKKLRYKEVPVHIQYTVYSLQKGQRLSDSIKIFFDLLLHKIFK